MSNAEAVVKLVGKLDQDPALPTRDLYKVLVSIRTKFMEQESILISQGIVGKLVHHLKRPNAKIVDVCLSIIGNLMLKDEARKQMKPHLRILSSILTSLNEESILARTCRVLANVAQDQECARILKSLGLMINLVKTFNELESPKAKASVVRAIRMLGALERKEKLLESNAIAAISSSLATDDEELLKAVTKCLAKFTNHGCDNFIALQIQGEGHGFQRLVECCKHQNRSIWEPALATLVNLSFIENLRPNLGNAGAIWTFIVKAHDKENTLSPGDFFRTVSALCLYCHESVNRMKIRDAGGLRLFVSILKDDQAERIVKEKIIKSFMQFSYDELSLKVLQHVGLVPALVSMVEEHNAKNFCNHSCEEFICNMDKREDEDITNEGNKKDELALVKDCNVADENESNDVDDLVHHNEDSNHEIVENPRNDERQYRINSPSYREVQGEVEEFARIRSSLPGSSWMTPPGHVGMSPLYSRSPSASPSRSASPVPSYHGSLLSSAESSPISDAEERYPPTYSPIETFSDDDDEPHPNQLINVGDNNSTHQIECISEPSSPPPCKRAKMSPTYITTYQPMYLPPPTIRRSTSTSSASKPTSEDETQMGTILQILSRLAQSEVPHDDLCGLKTIKALINYLCHTKKPSKRAGRIILRLSKNLYCLMPFINQRTLSWLKPEINNRPTLSDSPCQDCRELASLSHELFQNLSLLAETGYSEGVMCHNLVKGCLNDKQNVSIGAPLVVRPRKLLTNIMINHEGLDVLLNIIEQGSTDELFRDAIYSLSTLSGHIGIVSPNLKIRDEPRTRTCLYDESKAEKDLKIKVDDGQIIEVNKNVLTEASGVFEAMLAGQFLESNQSEVKIQLTAFQALKCLIHYFYGCRWCPNIANVSAMVLLELSALTDKYLLPDYNQSVSYEIVRRCAQVDQVVAIYEASLVKEYPMKGTDENLNACAISYILVGEMDNRNRADIFDSLIKSKVATDFMDDINQNVREKIRQ